jgi:3',5'-cyclic AMP phosphodiesterase CpdA
MPDVLGRQINRRQFLSLGLALAGGVVAIGPRCGRDEDARNRKDSTRWAFLSDTHVAADPEHRFRGFNPYRNLQEITAEIASSLPDGLVITGDLSRSKGGPGAYENVKSLLAPIAQRRPIYVAVGNHDHRGDFLQVFESPGESGEAVKDKHIVTAMAGPVRMIVLDTLLYVNTFPGMLGRPQRTWLETYLHVCDDTPTILFIHHTPRADLLDTRRLFEIIAPVKKVKAVVYGHSHKYEFCESHGIKLINLPAAGYNFTGAQPVGWVEARLTGEAGEFILHAVGGNARRDGRTTTVRWRT